MTALNIYCELLEVHDAVYAMRYSADPEFTDKEWRPALPGDKIPLREVTSPVAGELSGLMWPPIARQVFPRDAMTIDLRTIRVGDRIYTPLFIELFPQEIKPFLHYFSVLFLHIFHGVCHS